MGEAAVWRLSLTDAKSVRITWILWGVLFSAITCLVLTAERRTVTDAYRGAANAWIQGENLYSNTGSGFIYLPQASVLFVPFSILPYTAGEILWRLVAISSFVYGIRRITHLAGRDSDTVFFPLVSMMAIPLAWSSARNGQTTLLMAAMMMLATANIAYRQWWRATYWLALGLALKPLILVIALLVGALYRPMSWRLCVGAAGVFFFPFLTQSPDYVWQQYTQCITELYSAYELGTERLWAQLFGMLSVAGLHISSEIQFLVRLIVAISVLVMCWLGQKKLTATQTCIWIYSLATCYLMLFNPRTENTTYAMLGPVIGLHCAQALLVERRAIQSLAMVLITIGTVGSYEFGKMLVPAVYPIWLAPLMCICLTALLIYRTFLEKPDIEQPKLMSQKST